MKHEQLTAWALNELSPEEKAPLEAALQEDAAAQKQAAETREFCGFLSAHLFDANIALAEEQRAALQKAAAISSGERMNSTPVRAAALPAGKRAWWQRPMLRGLAAAAAVVLLATTGTLILRQQREQGRQAAQAAQAVAFMTEVGQQNAPEVKELAEIPREAPALPTLHADAFTGSVTAKPADLAAMSLPFGPVPPGQPESPDKLVAQIAPQTQWAAASPTAPLGTAPGVAGTGTLDYSELDLTSDLTRQRTLMERASNDTPQSPPVMPGMLALAGDGTSPAATTQPIVAHKNTAQPRPLIRSAGTLTQSGQNTATRGAVILDGRGKEVGLVMNPVPAPVATKAAPAAPSAPAAAAPSSRNYVDLNDPVVTTTGATTFPVMDPRANAAGVPIEGFSNVVGDVIPPAEIHPKPAPEPPGGLGVPFLKDIPAVGGLFKTENQPNNESYTRIVENVLQDVSRAPLSTFSIDVDTAAYANVRRFLNQNTAPPPDAVRIEELVNYFPTNAEGPAPQAKEPFAVGIEMAECPWQPLHRLARINIKGRDLGAERKPSNLVFLVDVSGSMNSPAKLPLVQQSLRMLAERLGEEDTVSMVVYAGSSGLVLPPTNGMKKAEILGAIDRLQAGGSTHGSAGIQLAYQQAVGGFIKGGVNRVILCTDGDFNVGVSSPEELEKLITEKARSGVFLSVLGYGTGNLKDRTMETLADKGNGNYAYIDSLSEARKVLVEQMGGTLVTIAKDVKIQVEFNPRVVRSYRLIGYENRLLAKEDFNDDTKDAGEIGAGHSVTALYELVPANLPPGAEPRAAVDDLKYQPRPEPAAPAATPAPIDDAQAKEALTVKLRYKEPEGSTSQLIEKPVNDDAKRIDAASSEFKFTAAVAGFGLLLRQSSYAGDLTWDKVRDLAQQGKGSDASGYRGEFLQLIEKARGVSGGR